MEDNFKQNDFEEFLKEQVKNHRMYPNDAVWRDINTRLHGDRRWPALTIAAFALLSATIMICVYFTPKPDIFAVNFSNNQPNNPASSKSLHTNGLNNLSSPGSLFKEKLSLTEVGKTQSAVAVVSSHVRSNNSLNDADYQNRLSTFKEKTAKKVLVSQTSDMIIVQKPTNTTIALNDKKEAANEGELLNLAISPEKKVTYQTVKPLAENQKAAKDYNDKNIVDNFLKEHKEDISLHTTSKIKSGKSKFSFQVYIAPSVSYRKLLEDNSILKEGTNSGPVGLNRVADVNKVVRHKPGNGLEAGASIMYNLTDHFRIKSGLQFNVRQYSIEAFRSNTEVASIELGENSRIDTVVRTLTIYRNSNGYYPAELVNRYYQIAVPVGVEWEIAGNKRIQLNVAGTIQPTYLLNHNAYLLSTNFKNYSENPNLVRSFNINSNIETYISFKVGDFKWQIGPQLRYQPYSTFVPQYPIKEHLLDYGVKLGLSKTF